MDLGDVDPIQSKVQSLFGMLFEKKQHLVSALHDVEATEYYERFVLRYAVNLALLTQQSSVIYHKIYYQNEKAETRPHNSLYRVCYREQTGGNTRRC